MKAWIAYLILFLSVLIGGTILLAMAFKAAPVKAEEMVQDFVQCTYKPSASDALTTYCGTLKGEGYLAIRICGEGYTVPIVCK